MSHPAEQDSGRAMNVGESETRHFTASQTTWNQRSRAIVSTVFYRRERNAAGVEANGMKHNLSIFLSCAVLVNFVKRTRT